METALTIPSNRQEVAASRPSLENLVAQFVAEQDISEASRETYSRSLRQFVAWLEVTGRTPRLGEMTRDDILAYKDYLQAGMSAYTVSSYLTTVRKLFEWLEAKKLYPNVARNVKGAKRPRGFRKDCLSEEQLRETLASMNADVLEGARDYAIFNLVARTGLRTIEVSRAAVADIRQEAGQAVLWIQGKGRDSKDDFVVLTPEAEKPLRQYLSMRQGDAHALAPEAALFCSHSDRNAGQALTTRSISRLIKEALKRVGLNDSRLTAHSLRHTAITLSIKGGASLQQAQAMARHTDPKTTLVYFHNLARVADGAEKYVRF